MSAFIFVPLLAITIAITAAIWAYASHVFVVITEETAVGNDVVGWDDEPMFDWLWQAGYLAWLIGVWVVPAVFIAKFATAGLDERWRWYVFALIGFTVFWLSFPISLLSSMSAESRMAVFHGPLLQRLARRGGDLFIFYLLSAVLVAVSVPLAPWLMTSDGTVALVVASPLLALCFALYARLMGRLACLARLTQIRPRRKKKKLKPTKGVEVSDPWEVPDEVRQEEEARGTGFVQPRDLPAVETPYEGDMTGYDVRFDDGPRSEPVPAPVSEPMEEPVPVARVDEEVEERVAAQSRRARQDVSAIQPDRLEMERLSRKEETAPDRPWINGIWLFPLQPRTLTHVVVLALCLVVLGVLVQVLRATWPWN